MVHVKTLILTFSCDHFDVKSKLTAHANMQRLNCFSQFNAKLSPKLDDDVLDTLMNRYIDAQIKRNE